jgi:hypothetical protein
LPPRPPTPVAHRARPRRGGPKGASHPFVPFQRPSQPPSAAAATMPTPPTLALIDKMADQEIKRIRAQRRVAELDADLSISRVEFGAMQSKRSMGMNVSPA